MLWSQIPVRFDGACTNAPGSCARAAGVEVGVVDVVAGVGLAGADGADEAGGFKVGAAVDTAVASNAGQL